MLCCFISKTSLSMSCAVRARPRSGSHSWRLTPRKRMRRPLTVKRPSSTAMVRKPTRRAIVSPPALSVPSYSGAVRPTASISGSRCDRSWHLLEADLRNGEQRGTSVTTHSVPDRLHGRSRRGQSSSSMDPAGREITLTSRKIRTATTCPGPPGSSPATTGVPAPATTFAPARRCEPTSNSVVSRLPEDQPSSAPLHHTVNAESTPRNRSTARRQAAGRQLEETAILAGGVLVRHVGGSTGKG